MGCAWKRMSEQLEAGHGDSRKPTLSLKVERDRPAGPTSAVQFQVLREFRRVRASLALTLAQPICRQLHSLRVRLPPVNVPNASSSTATPLTAYAAATSLSGTD